MGGLLKKKEKRSLLRFIQPPRSPLTVEDLVQFFKEEFGSSITRKWATRVLKEEMNYSFKKCSSRVIKSSQPIFHKMRILYSIQLLNHVLEGRWVISLDESSFSRALTRNYSWTPRGWSSSILNLRWADSCSLIWASFIDGNFLWAIIPSTVNSRIYSQFLKMLNHWIKERGF